MGFFDKGRKERKDYKPEGSGRRKESSGGSRYSENKTMTTVTCDACGKSCTVPFQPTAGKPVYCNDCFRKDDRGSRGDRPSYGKQRKGSDSRRHSDSGPSSNDLAKINTKLDKILLLLEMNADIEDETFEEPVKKVVKKTVKKPIKKAVKKPIEETVEETVEEE